MSRTILKDLKQRRVHRNRARISGSADKPRLSVNVSNLHVSAQLIDDNSGHTLAAATSVGSKSAKGNLTDKAAKVGEEIANKATKAKVKQVVFDRGGKRYHGHVKALAESARKNGLEF